MSLSALLAESHTLQMFTSPSVYLESLPIGDQLIKCLHCNTNAPQTHVPTIFDFIRIAGSR